MAEHTSFGRRVARVVAFAIGGGVALTLALSSAASADEVIVQDAEVVNAGAAAANSGGNVAVGNTSDNTATTNQTANGGLLASNVAATENQSSGTASVTTGAATATGSAAETDVSQDVDTDGDDAGVTVVAQDADVVNAGAAAANSGLNLAVGNASDNDATTTQDADGALASNTANTSNSSDGTASITTGAATATGNRSETDIEQSAATGDGAGPVTVLVQDSGVINAGAALANSGLNFAFGNVSDSDATTDQTANGVLLGSNVADTSNSSDGDASITTGAATATGNWSDTSIAQTIDSPDPPGLAVVVQNDVEVNLGLALANTGFNFPVGNNATDNENVVQVANGLIASNVSTGGSSAAGDAAIWTGTATATGNLAATKLEQLIT